MKAGDFSNVTLLGEAFSKCFLQIDVIIRGVQDQTNSRDSSGCTAVCAVITPTHILCANAGDSRCVLGTAGITKNLSEDHKPTDDGERRRIENAGGRVQWKRVDGDLAVSRALGDFQFKARDDLPPEQQRVRI